MTEPTSSAAAPAPLTPPEGAPLTLTAPAPPALVVATQAPAIAPQVDPALLPELDGKVDGFLTTLMAAQTRSPEFAQQAANVRAMGDADIRRAAETSNRLLQTPVRALKEGGLAEGSKVGNTLLELRRTVEDLDPSRATGTRKFLGMIPFGDKITDYFRRYESAQGHLDGILHALRNGQDELTKDDVALNLEKQNLWGAMGRLNAYIYVAERLDARLAATIAQLELSDPERAKALSQDVLFYVRQKHQDLLTQLAVSIQSYLAIDIIIKNNIELIKGVDRASTTTISALRTAVIVAQALGNQRLVLDQITALNTTTSDLIQRTSEMMRDTSAQIQQQAASATIGLPSSRRHSRTSTPRWIPSTTSSSRRWTPWLQPSAPWRPKSPSHASTSIGCSAKISNWLRAPWTSRVAPPPAGCADPTSGFSIIVGVTWASRTGSQPSPAGVRNHHRYQCSRHQQRRPNPTSCALWSASRTWSGAAWYRRRFSPESAGLLRPYARPCPDCVTSGSGSPEAYSVMATATDYLPEAVGAYTRLPRQWADSRPIENGKTSLMLLIDQLDLLGATMDKIFDAVVRVDADALIVHGRFLQEKFGHASTGGALNIGDQPAPEAPRSTLDLP